jgi:glycosyltransferase involved in cell wall biosynthesis
MKLLVATSAPSDGGAGISAYTRTLAASLAEAGHEVHYASPSHTDSFFIDTHGIRHIPTDRGDDPIESAERLLHHIRTHSVEGCVNNDNPVLQSIAPGLDMPLVVVCHMDRRIVASLCTLHSDWVDHLVCISNDMQKTMIKRYGFPNTKCRLIHNGTVDPGHSGQFEQSDPQKLHVVCTGGWTTHKGGPRVMESVLAHPHVWKRVQLDWFGLVPEKIQAKVAHLPNIRFRGQVPQAAFHETLGAADALVFASDKEGCPMTMLEAMSWGVLPIATDGVGAMRWLIDSGREGFICHLRDWARQLAECVGFLADRPETVASMKRAARDRYLRDFQASQNAERILDLVRHPTVDRSTPQTRFDVIRWHRPVARPGRPQTILEKVRYRTGWLDVAGRLEATEIEVLERPTDEEAK